MFCCEGKRSVKIAHDLFLYHPRNCLARRQACPADLQLICCLRASKVVVSITRRSVHRVSCEGDEVGDFVLARAKHLARCGLGIYPDSDSRAPSEVPRFAIHSCADS